MDETNTIYNKTHSDLRRYLDTLSDTDYRQSVKDMLTDLINYSVANGWTLRQLAKRVNVSPTTVHRLLSGTYSAPAKPHLDKMDDLCGMLALRRVNNAKQAYVPTQLGRYIQQVAQLTHVNQYASMLVGKTQWGKTTALEEYVRQHPGTAVMVRCPVTTSPSRILYRIAASLGQGTTGKVDEIISRICNALSSEHLLIVDEIHQALECDRMGRKCIEQLREIYDSTHCGLLLVGTPVLAETLHSNARWKLMLEQTSKRSAAKIFRLPEDISTDDIRTLWTNYGYPNPDRAILAKLRELANTAGFGLTTKRLHAGLTAAHNAGAPVSWDYYLAAEAKLLDMEKGLLLDQV